MESSASGFNLGGNGGNGGRRPRGSKRRNSTGTRKNNRIPSGKAPTGSNRSRKSRQNHPYPTQPPTAQQKRIEAKILDGKADGFQTYSEYLLENVPKDYFDEIIKPILEKYQILDKPAVRPNLGERETVGNYLKRIKDMFVNRLKPREPRVYRPYVPPTPEELAARLEYEQEERDRLAAELALAEEMASRRGYGVNHWRSSKN